MNPKQIILVEWTVRRTRTQRAAIAADFYDRLFAAHPELHAMFPADTDEQAEKFAAELDAIVGAMRHSPTLVTRASLLGARHDRYGVTPSHYAAAGAALLGALAAALGPAWTPTVEEAWRCAFDLVAEEMMAGASAREPVSSRAAQFPQT